MILCNELNKQTTLEQNPIAHSRTNLATLTASIQSAKNEAHDKIQKVHYGYDMFQRNNSNFLFYQLKC